MDEGHELLRNVSGPFSARKLRTGRWHLYTEASVGAELFLEGVRAEDGEHLQGKVFASLGLEWHADEVSVTLAGVTGVRHLSASSAVLHEPQPRLYEALPLAVFDAGAKRFWNRVFSLLRIPGGRHLLRFIAASRRPVPRRP
jgi:hypothetical protein